MPIRERPFLRQVRHVHPDLRDPRTVTVRRQIQRDFGMLVPPFLLHLPAPDVLKACWTMVREPSRGATVDRSSKEAVAAAVSAANACPYCVDVHTTTLHGFGSPGAAAAIASGRPETIADPGMRHLVTWALATREPVAPILRRRPFTDEQAPEVIGVAVAFHYINRMVNIFAARSPFPAAWAQARPMFRRLAAPVLRKVLGGQGEPGASLDLLPEAPLPHDFGWARRDPIIASAFARAAAAIEAAGERSVPDSVRRLVAERIAVWRGEQPGLSRGWADGLLETLPSSQRAQGRLALLAALSSHQVDASVVDAARTEQGPPGDERLISTTAWASFAAARRIGSWLPAEASDREAVA